MAIDTFVADAVSSTGMALPIAQKNATSKQYNMSVVMKVTETNGDKTFYDASSVWTGVDYGIVVVTQKALVELLGKFNDLGAAVASGSTTPPAKP